MKKLLLATIALIIVSSFTARAQWSTNNSLSDLNTWSAQPGLIGWYNTSTNTPNGAGYGSGIQMVLPTDTRYGSQIVIPTFDGQMYYRNNMVTYWQPWVKLWSTLNLDPDTYLDRSVVSLSTVGSANSFANGYTFAYQQTGTPWHGSLISYGGFGGDYDTQISSDYGPNGGKHMSFRTMNGDNHTWNPWYELYSSGNLNNADADFAAKTINCTNVYTNGKIWAKEIKVATTNPFPDYVFKPNYRLRSLSEVKTYIDRNHRLPEMPSDKEVEKDGLNVGEINLLLTKKVEELTLYLIEKDKELKEERAKNQDQECRIQKLEQLFKTIKK